MQKNLLPWKVSVWVDGVFLSAVDSSLLTDSAIVNALLEL